MKNIKWIALPLLFSFLPALGISVGLSLGLSGCVTVNVNIPDSDIQQASDDYVKELYEAKTTKPKPSPSPSASPRAHMPDHMPGKTTSKTSALSLISDFLAPSALAADPVSTRSPKLDELMKRMRSRIDELVPLKKSGILGETNDGRLAIRGKPTPGQKKHVEKLVSETNNDRKELYQEILAHNGFSKKSLGTIEESFAHSFQKHSPAGTWIQDKHGGWSQKQ